MRNSSKLLLTGAFVTIAIGVAWQFRRADQRSSSTATNADPLPPLERRIIGTGGQTLPVAPDRQNRHSAFRVPTAATGFLPDRAVEPPRLPSNYQHVFSPVGALLKPIDMDDGQAEGAFARERDDPARADAATPISHEIKDGDTLSTLATHYLGDPTRAAELFAANRDVLSSPDLLPLGKVLQIPPRIPIVAAPGTAAFADDCHDIEPPVVPIPRGALSQ
jgi:hypothetical protein